MPGRIFVGLKDGAILAWCAWFKCAIDFCGYCSNCNRVAKSCALLEILSIKNICWSIWNSNAVLVVEEQNTFKLGKSIFILPHEVAIATQISRQVEFLSTVGQHSTIYFAAILVIQIFDACIMVKNCPIILRLRIKYSSFYFNQNKYVRFELNRDQFTLRKE